jgi:hypothetical protein
MERFRKLVLNGFKKCRFVGPALVITGLALIVTAHAEERQPYKFNLVAASDTIAACLPDVTATVTIIPSEEVRGVDTFDLRGSGMPPNTSFTVFLTELADIPFGASEYIGEFTTNAAGRGSLRVETVIDEAFSSTLVNNVRTRVDLNHVVLWFADPAGDDVCFGPGAGPITPFDGDGDAGGTLVSSKNFLPGAPLP